MTPQTRSLPPLLAWFLGLASWGCADDGPHPQPDVAPVSTTKPMGDCAAVVRVYEGGTSTHYPDCSSIDYAMSPPVFGDHYPTWAAYGTYDFALPLGFLVHDLEHGAIVFFYDCPGGCDDEVALAQATIDALPDDPRCSPDVRVQVVLVPRPGLGSRWAGAAWGSSVSADCFDPEIFRQFYEQRQARGREDLCNQGTRFEQDPCK